MGISRKTSLSLLTLVTAIGTAVTSSALAAPVVGPNGNSYEFVSAEYTNWFVANTAAISAGGHLVTITSAQEQQFLEQSVIPNAIGSIFIGLTDTTVEGTFEWVTGETFFYSNWANREPNNGFGGEDWVGLYALGNPSDAAPGKWNDTFPDCAPEFCPNNSPFKIIGYIVEYEKVPEPGTLALLGLGLAGLAASRWRKR